MRETTKVGAVTVLQGEEGWATRCDKHRVEAMWQTQYLAIYWAPEPWAWCEECEAEHSQETGE